MMPGETQDVFLKRIRASLGSRGEPVELPDDLDVARVVARDADAVSTFMTTAEQAYMHPVRVADEAAVVAKVIEIVRGVGGKKVIMPEEDFPGRQAIAGGLESAGLSRCDHEAPDAAFDADVGITGARLAVAETASLSLISGGPHRRLASLAVPVHIAVVRASQIIPDLLDWPAAKEGEIPAAETLVSSPSKTADIELNLVMGVHGPREEYVIILDD